MSPRRTSPPQNDRNWKRNYVKIAVSDMEISSNDATSLFTNVTQFIDQNETHAAVRWDYIKYHNGHWMDTFWSLDMSKVKHSMYNVPKTDYCTDTTTPLLQPALRSSVQKLGKGLVTHQSQRGQSACTISSTSSRKLMRRTQPRSSRALVLSPSNSSTSVGR